MADTSPAPGVLKRSEVLAQAEEYERRRKSPEWVPPTLLVWIGAAVMVVGLLWMVSAFVPMW